MSTPRVCVVGAGVAGLVTIKECKNVGLDPVCYELHSELGEVGERERGEGGERVEREGAERGERGGRGCNYYRIGRANIIIFQVQM